MTESEGRQEQFLQLGILAAIRFLTLAALPIDAILGYGDYLHFFNLAEFSSLEAGLPWLGHWVEFPPLFPYLSLGIHGAAGGSLHREVKALVSSLGLEPYVEFLGGYDIEDLPKLLHHHDIYVSANHFDGTSLSLLEAMAGGIFPVVSRITGNLAWVKDNDTALMFNPGDANELADAVIRVVDNPSLRMAAVEKNRALIERRGAREENMMALEQRYYQLLG